MFPTGIGLAEISLLGLPSLVGSIRIYCKVDAETHLYQWLAQHRSLLVGWKSLA